MARVAETAAGRTVPRRVDDVLDGFTGVARPPVQLEPHRFGTETIGTAGEAEDLLGTAGSSPPTACALGRWKTEGERATP